MHGGTSTEAAFNKDYAARCFFSNYSLPVNLQVGKFQITPTDPNAVAPPPCGKRPGSVVCFPRRAGPAHEALRSRTESHTSLFSRRSALRRFSRGIASSLSDTSLAGIPSRVKPIFSKLFKSAFGAFPSVDLDLEQTSSQCGHQMALLAVWQR